MTKLQEINSDDLLREIKKRIERPTFQEKVEAKITDLKIDKEKLTAQLNDGREVSISISLLTNRLYQKQGGWKFRNVFRTLLTNPKTN